MSNDSPDIVSTYCGNDVILQERAGDNFAKAFSKYFDIVKFYNYGARLQYKKILQAGNGKFNMNSDSYNNGAFVLKNDMIIFSSGCWWTDKHGVDFVVDTNGLKGLNKFGYDFFYFQINEDDRLVLSSSKYHFYAQGAEHAGCCNMLIESSTCSSNNGTACSHFALKDQSPSDINKSYWKSLR